MRKFEIHKDYYDAGQEMFEKPPQEGRVRYRLTLTPEQAKIVERACEFYARIRDGQFQELIYELWDNGEFDSSNSEVASEAAYKLRGIMFPKLGEDRGRSYGIHHNKQADIAWDAYIAIRHSIAWHEHPEGGFGVCFDDPFFVSGEPHPECAVLNPADKSK